MMLGFFHQQNHHHLVSLLWGLVPELGLSVFNQIFCKINYFMIGFNMLRLAKVHKPILHLDFLLVLRSLFFVQFHPYIFLGNPQKKTIQTNGKHDIPSCLFEDTLRWKTGHLGNLGGILESDAADGTADAPAGAARAVARTAAQSGSLSARWAERSKVMIC